MEQNNMTETKKYVYDASEIFHDIKDDPENITMKIPDEIAESMGWEPGDVLRIRVYEDSQQIEISKVDTTENNNE